MEMDDMPQAIARLQQQVSTLEGSDDDQWTKINRLRDRPPVWVAWVGTGGGAIIGFLMNALLNCLWR